MEEDDAIERKIEEFFKKMIEAKDFSELEEVTKQFISFLDGLSIATKNPIDKLAIITSKALKSSRKELKVLRRN